MHRKDILFPTCQNALPWIYFKLVGLVKKTDKGKQKLELFGSMER